MDNEAWKICWIRALLIWRSSVTAFCCCGVASAAGVGLQSTRVAIWSLLVSTFKGSVASSQFRDPPSTLLGVDHSQGKLFLSSCCPAPPGDRPIRAWDLSNDDWECCAADVSLLPNIVVDEVLTGSAWALK